MEPNILLQEAPSTVEVGGALVKINTDFRVGIQALKAIEDPTTDEYRRIGKLVDLLYAQEGVIPQQVLQHGKESIEKALLFLNFNEPQRPRMLGVDRPRAMLRDWDWDWDAPRLLADFQREYHIDLVDPTLEMHWWRFWSLFRNLSDTSATMHAISIRGTSLDGLDGRERERIRRLQSSVLLPARTEKEAMAITASFYGVE